MDTSGLRIRSMLDWQHAVVLSLFLHVGMPYGIQKTTRSLEVCLSLNYRTALTGYRKMNKYGRVNYRQHNLKE